MNWRGLQANDHFVNILTNSARRKPGRNGRAMQLNRIERFEGGQPWEPLAIGHWRMPNDQSHYSGNCTKRD
jgi:hypothetical protein